MRSTDLARFMASMPVPMTISDRRRGGGYGRLDTEIRMSVDVKPVAHVGLVIGDLPREPTEHHAHEDDGDGPYVRQARVVSLLGEHFRREVRVGTDNPRSGDLVLARVVKDGGRTEIDELDDIVAGHDAVVEFEITMSQSHLVQVVDTVDNLPENTVDFRSRHLARHDD